MPWRTCAERAGRGFAPLTTSVRHCRPHDSGSTYFQLLLLVFGVPLGLAWFDPRFMCIRASLCWLLFLGLLPTPITGSRAFQHVSNNRWTPCAVHKQAPGRVLCTGTRLRRESCWSNFAAMGENHNLLRQVKPSVLGAAELGHSVHLSVQPAKPTFDGS